MSLYYSIFNNLIYYIMDNNSLVNTNGIGFNRRTNLVPSRGGAALEPLLEDFEMFRIRHGRVT